MRRMLTGFIVSTVLAAVPLYAAETTAPLVTAAPVQAIEKSVTAAPLVAKRFRVGYADITKVAEQSEVGKVAKTHFEAKADRLKAQIETKQKLLEKRKATLEAKLQSYTPEQRTAKIKEYEKKVAELRTLLQKADAEMKPLQEELLREIAGKIEKAASEYGAANGFSIIVEKRELLYLGSNIDAEDVTAALVKQLNGK